MAGTPDKLSFSVDLGDGYVDIAYSRPVYGRPLWAWIAPLHTHMARAYSRNADTPAPGSYPWECYAGILLRVEKAAGHVPEDELDRDSIYAAAHEGRTLVYRSWRDNEPWKSAGYSYVEPDGGIYRAYREKRLVEYEALPYAEKVKLIVLVLAILGYRDRVPTRLAAEQVPYGNVLPVGRWRNRTTMHQWVETLNASMAKDQGWGDVRPPRPGSYPYESLMCSLRNMSDSYTRGGWSIETIAKAAHEGWRECYAYWKRAEPWTDVEAGYHMPLSPLENEHREASFKAEYADLSEYGREKNNMVARTFITHVANTWVESGSS